MRPLLFAAILTAIALPAAAQPELPEVRLDRIPPSYSYDIGVVFGMGELGWWREEIPPWMHFGLFAAWGKHLRNGDSVGFGGTLLAEGPFPLHSTFALDPVLRWDRVQGKLALGASVGGSLMFHSAQKPIGVEQAVSASPLVTARFGWSQGFTRVGRRIFVIAEPKLRYMVGKLSPGISLAVGVGQGY
jgi:hypothetical protein